MDYTGERYHPEQSGDIALEHKHRYLMACQLAKGLRVLDIASGEGYGSALLASVAAHVTGVDISEQAVIHATQKYALPNLEYRHGSATAIPLPDASVDLVVSFETIEHHDQHEAMLQEIKRVLRPGGLMYMSSPDRVEYSDIPGFKNAFHVKELTKDEFVDLVKKHFANYIVSGQRVLYGSVIGLEESPEATPFLSWDYASSTLEPSRGVPRPIYILILASDGPLPASDVGLMENSIEHSDAYRQQIDAVQQLTGQLSTLQEKLAAEMQVQASELQQQMTAAAKASEALLQEATTMMQQRDMQLQAVQRELAAVYASRSWRITKPLRLLSEALTRFLSKAR